MSISFLFSFSNKKPKKKRTTKIKWISKVVKFLWISLLFQSCRLKFQICLGIFCYCLNYFRFLYSMLKFLSVFHFFLFTYFSLDSRFTLFSREKSIKKEKFANSFYFLFSHLCVMCSQSCQSYLSLQFQLSIYFIWTFHQMSDIKHPFQWKSTFSFQRLISMPFLIRQFFIVLYAV